MTGIIGWIAIGLCAWLGWRRDLFFQWPLAVMIASAVAFWIVAGVFDAPFSHRDMAWRAIVGTMILGTLSYWSGRGIRRLTKRQ